MDVSEDVTNTLRAEAHHPPCVMESKDNSGEFRTGNHSAGFCTEHSAKSRTIGYLCLVSSFNYLLSCRNLGSWYIRCFW